jgi:hypothetical protein
MAHKKKKAEYVIVISLGMLLTVSFYFIDPVDFLEKLGYATLAALSLVELGEILLKKTGG